eukprot:Plantae.Rhodophyta-Hildenbrandia_rubra.ctg26462.p1 GENE.Plantae.Rhodophyta-Hildenbrandia_rubra.ctg26462~~Plantae.Rhodophyta-Hildenbrandia_rubra.ctg26462.p1  ORF type:complete len:316 (+),score=41.04 Plantae.Rhodophyta-Hildenbrandia_rubra.ctg26462:169-1116(+)
MVVAAFLILPSHGIRYRFHSPALNSRFRYPRFCSTYQRKEPIVLTHRTASPPRQDFYGIPSPGPSGRLLLSDLRERLIRQEETIIFALIERAQFQRNDCVYRVGAFELPEPNLSFLAFLLLHLERSYALVRRYTSPDEHPFTETSDLPQPVLPLLDYPGTLAPNNINHNKEIHSTYLEKILPRIADAGDDQNYGSSSTCDVSCLQALSKRIHYGKFIAEAKFEGDRDLYTKLGLEKNRQGIWDALSDDIVEEKLLARVENKARTYGREITDAGSSDSFKVMPRTIRQIYKDFIIPLTKQVEIDYLIYRASADISS